MEVEEVDSVSGRNTTGHVWNGIKELDTPIPRGVLLFLIATHIFALVWWVLLPTWPIGKTYTKGLLGVDQKTVVEEALREGVETRASWVRKIESLPYDQIQADPRLMAIVRSTGNQLFGDNCAACHGRDGKGGANYPNLADDDWIWGGGPENIHQTITVGVNSRHAETRVGMMPAFGKDEMLDRQQVRDVAAFVISLSASATSTAENADQVDKGREVFAITCAACHGDNAKGNPEMGAPNLTDSHWIYGGGLQTIIDTIHGGRQGHMPTWDERFSPSEIKILALYVDALSQQEL